MGYTPSFTPQYENGWENLPSETSPITAEALNAYDDAIENIEDYLASDESQANLADAYDETATYEAGDYVIYGGDLYKCLEDIDEPEEWDSTKWESCLITDEMATSGGTTVIANPSGQATDTLTKLQVENTIYGISGGGGSANIWEGTQAELEEQFDDIPNETAIIVIDDEESIDASAEIYSEDERLIGLWTDNKPLYQKTIDCGTLPNATQNFISTGFVSGTIDVKNLYGYSYNPTNDITLALPRPSYSSTDSIDVITAQSNGYESIRISTATNYLAFTDTKITIQYTKTADAPLSGVIAGKSTMYVASSDCYSTEEKEIGCWTDGKTLYQKTIDCGALPNSADKAIAHGIANIDKIVSVDAIGWRSVSPLYIYPIPYAQTQVQYQVGMYMTPTEIHLQTVYDASAIDNSRVTIKYTKTTDTAGSGKFTPAGTKTEHYSTEEQVIGTWINGETLYRKTIHKVNTAVINGTEIAHGISNLAMCTKLDVICYDESGTSFPIMAIGSQYADNSSERSMGFRVNATNFVAYGKNEFTALTTRHWYFTVDYIKTT